MSSRKEVLVVGLGAVGVIYGFVLKQAGKTNVTCVARSNYRATLEKGINIRSKVYGDIPGWKPDRLFSSVSDAADRSYSHVFVTTKALPEITPMASILSPLLVQDNSEPLPVFVMLQNGFDGERDLYNTLKKLDKGEPKIISTALWIGTNLLPGNIISHVMAERLTAGIYRPNFIGDIKNTLEEATTLEDFASLFEGTNSELHIVDEVQRVKFKKNFWNACMGVSSTLIRYPLPAFFREKAAEEVALPQLRAIMQEILAVGRAIGFDESALPSDTIDQAYKNTAALHKAPDSSHRASMLLDLEQGKPMEIEVVLGVLVRKAREHNVDIPRLELIYSYLYLIQQQLLAGSRS